MSLDVLGRYYETKRNEKFDPISEVKIIETWNEYTNFRFEWQLPVLRKFTFWRKEIFIIKFCEKMVNFCFDYKTNIMFDIDELKGLLILIKLLNQLNDDLNQKDRIYLENQFKNIINDFWFRKHMNLLITTLDSIICHKMPHPSDLRNLYQIAQ